MTNVIGSGNLGNSNGLGGLPGTPLLSNGLATLQGDEAEDSAQAQAALQEADVLQGLGTPQDTLDPSLLGTLAGQGSPWNPEGSTWNPEGHPWRPEGSPWPDGGRWQPGGTPWTPQGNPWNPQGNPWNPWLPSGNPLNPIGTPWNPPGRTWEPTGINQYGGLSDANLYG